MTDLQAPLVASIQQVRAKMPRECDEGCGTAVDWHSDECDARWAARVDARLAACVEAAIDAAARAPFGLSLPGTLDDGLAAFLAAAAQKETT